MIGFGALGCAIFVILCPALPGENMTVVADHFACEVCGRRHEWTNEIAGQSARCACGSVITVPQAPIQPAALDYRSAPSAREKELQSYLYRVEPMRDVVVPYALMGMGALLYAGIPAIRFWGKLDLQQISALCVVFLVITAIESAVMVGLACVFAWALDISFGRLSLASRKIVGLVAFANGVNSMRFGHAQSEWAIVLFYVVLALTVIVYFGGLPYLFQMSLLDSRKIILVLSALFAAVHFVILANFRHIAVHVAGMRIFILGR